MQYISFYKDRLPFKPKSNVVIYFDVMSINRKHRPYDVINEVYDMILEEFQRGGLEFCFLPRIAEDMDLGKTSSWTTTHVDKTLPHAMPYCLSVRRRMTFRSQGQVGGSRLLPRIPVVVNRIFYILSFVCSCAVCDDSAGFLVKNRAIFIIKLNVMLIIEKKVVSLWSEILNDLKEEV
ncbi:MAG: hypothetical protein IJP75_09565 [Bacteroidaceae bacterium]|nr:hypothetical protein [Bacteroidaceae bacterium]